MNATALPDAKETAITTPLRQRAADVIKAWNVWRATRIRGDRAIDAGVFGLLLVSWTLGYVALCPPSDNHRHVDLHEARR